MDTSLKKTGFNGKQFVIWMSALIVGCVLGLLHCGWLMDFFDFIATAYTKLFKFLAVPTIALAILTTLATLGARKNTGKIFLHTIKYTLMTTIMAGIVGAVLYVIIKPGNLSLEMIAGAHIPDQAAQAKANSVYEHILNVFPDNILAPLSSGNVLSIVLVSAAVGLALALMNNSENTKVLLKCLLGLQELLFTLIRALVWTLPVGIVAFSAQLSNQLASQGAVGTLGKYVAVVIGGNLIQFFIILPLFLLIRKINPLKVFRCMLPAVLMALFTKSSAATLPVTVASAENNLKAKPEVARFILPMCCTINMNGCAAFILVTSMFVMQNSGIELTAGTIIVWLLIATISAIGNAGVPMGCFFLTLSLMCGLGGNIQLGIMGLILPIYAIIDMIETAENVWSDCCICAIVNKIMGYEDEKTETASK